ncbi:putative RNA-directed DNA polymerase, eukaryota, reverse transcriptase zinc-binding domain protein [Tanacetum coccineum]
MTEVYISQAEANTFNTFITSNGLIELPMGSRLFTWMNKISYGRITTPILFHCTKADYGPTPFILYHSWFNRDGFHQLISSEWNSFGQNNNNQSFLSHAKLKELKAKIKVWLRDTKNSERRHKEEILAALKNLNIKVDSNTASLEDRDSRTQLLHEINKIDSLEILDLHQKSCIKWEVEGDENSMFFHGLVNQRRRKNLFTASCPMKFQPHDSMIDLPSITFPSNLSSFDHNILEPDATLEEIKTAVWDCGNDKALGPDDFTFGFVRRYWENLKHNIMKFVTRFLETKKMPMGSNSSFITLILKVSNPIHVKDYSPISLINIHYKIIAKVLANRLAKVVDKIVSQEQSTFISGRQIFDGPLILSEMIDWITWRPWIKACLESSRTSILVNGSPSSKFFIKRGLRQGDPLSPFLFIIVIEGLHIALSEASHSGLIHGIKIVFYLASGLKINIHKSNVYGVGVSENEKVLLDRFDARLSKWKVPESVLKILEKKRASFFWGNSQDASLLQKWHWRIISTANALWVKVVKAFHGQKGGFSFNETSSKERDVVTDDAMWNHLTMSSSNSVLLVTFGIMFEIGVTSHSLRALRFINGRLGLILGRRQKKSNDVYP